MILKALYSVLNNDTDFVNAVGKDGTGNVKLYPGEAGRDIGEPYVVFEVTGNEPSTVKTNPSTINFWDLDFFIYSHNRSDLENIHQKLRAKLDYLKTTDSGVEINRATYIDSTDDYDSDAQLHLREDQYTIRARQTS